MNGASPQNYDYTMIVYNVFVLFQSFSIKRVQYLKQLRPMSRGRERCHTRRRAAAEGSGSSAEEGHWSFAKPSCFPKLSTPHSKMWVCKMWVCIQEGEFPTRKTIYYGFSLLLIFSDGCPYSTHRLSLLDGGENQLLSVSRGGLPNTDPLVRQAQEEVKAVQAEVRSHAKPWDVCTCAKPWGFRTLTMLVQFCTGSVGLATS